MDFFPKNIFCSKVLSLALLFNQCLPDVMSKKANLNPQSRSDKNILWFQIGGKGAAV